MASTKNINMLLNFRKDMPDEIVERLRNFYVNSTSDKIISRLCSDYQHPCGSPVIDFYACGEKLGQYQTDDGTYYLRYCNQIKDYDNHFETWLESVAPWIIQTNGNHVGIVYNDCSREMSFICIEKEKPVYKKLVIQD